MLHIYVYDNTFQEKLQYHYSGNDDGLCGKIFRTESPLSEKPPYNRCWVVTSKLLKYKGDFNMVDEIFAYEN